MAYFSLSWPPIVGTYRSARSDGRVVRFSRQDLGTVLMFRVKVGVMSTVQGDTGKDEEERMRDKGSRVSGKAQGFAQVTSKEELRRMIGNGQGGCNTHNVLGTRPPPSLINFTTNVLVQESVIHL